MALNKCIFHGRLAKPIELRQTQSGVAVTSFDIAVDRQYKSGEEKQTDWIRVQAWRGVAEFCAKYLDKGSAIIVEGRLQNDNYTDKDGVKRYSFVVVADQIYFAESKRNSENTGAPAYSASATDGGFEELDDSNGLPF